jgi:hypothetical protein
VMILGGLVSLGSAWTLKQIKRLRIASKSF